ncbi:MAG: transposase [Spirochaetota bacterium]
MNEDFARNLLSWRHSGFSIDNKVRILDKEAQKSLAQYIARPPLSLKKIYYEPFKGRVLFHTTYNEYFGENVHMFDSLDFIAELTQHIPPKRIQLIRRYGLYSSRGKGTWAKMEYVAERAPRAWKEEHGSQTTESLSFDPLPEAETVNQTAVKSAWARLLAKIYELHPFVCEKCGSDMRVIAVIQDQVEIKKILKHLVKIGRSPPGLNPASLN